MANKINEKLGLKPQTRARQATHGSSLISSAQCPKCLGRHVIQNAIHGVLTRLCGRCGWLWPGTPIEATR